MTVCDDATDHVSTVVRTPLKIIKKKSWKETEGSADVHTKTSSVNVPYSMKNSILSYRTTLNSPRYEV